MAFGPSPYDPQFVNPFPTEPDVYGEGEVQGFVPEGRWAVPKRDVCNALICCGDDDPIPNYTADVPIKTTFVSVSFHAKGCVRECVSDISQDDANMCALAQALLCRPGTVTNDPQTCIAYCPDGTTFTYTVEAGRFTSDTKEHANELAYAYACEQARALAEAADCTPTTGRFLNNPQSCDALCPDGTTFTYTVPYGRFAADTQAEADALAYAYACAHAADHMICLPILSGTICSNVYLSIEVAATGNPLVDGSNVWTVDSGALPDGMTLLTAGGNSCYIEGTPTNPGSFTFTLKVVAPNGDSGSKSYTLNVLGITTATLPDGHTGLAYSQTLTASGGSGSYTFGIESGTLPAGLSMDSSGNITGTPTVAGTQTIVFKVTS